MSEILTPHRMKVQIDKILMPRSDIKIDDAEYTHVNHSSLLKRRTDLDRKYQAEYPDVAAKCPMQFWAPPVWLIKVAARYETHQFRGKRCRMPHIPDADFELLVVTVYSHHPDAAQKFGQCIRNAFYRDIQTLMRIQPEIGVEYCQWAPGISG